MGEPALRSQLADASAPHGVWAPPASGLLWVLLVILTGCQEQPLGVQGALGGAPPVFEGHYEGYRFWLGTDRETEWVDLCCKIRDQDIQKGQGKPCWADYSPIQRVEREEQNSVTTFYWVEKERSLWRVKRNQDLWIVSLVKPTSPEGCF